MSVFLNPSFADLVVIAGEFHPIPFRTRPLKPPAPMVLRLKPRESRSPPGLRRKNPANTRKRNSAKSWEDAAKNAVETAANSLRDLRVAEIEKLDLKIEDGKVVAYRARVSLSFKYEA
jgi:flavin-binding protein dodecin